jgi:GcvH upstream region-like protein
MLEFFRRYQRGFFIAVTVVIVISFSFFGTFNAFMSTGPEDKAVFTALDGAKVYRSELNDMVTILSSDAHDQLFLNVLWGGNSLNDGVIPKDFIETGLAQVVAAPYLKELSEELQIRLEKEKRYTPYANPKVPFISAEQIWAYFAPDLKQNFDTLRQYSNAETLDSLRVRSNLFLAERKFPGIYLKQLLKYQEAQHNWLPPDEGLTHHDLSLFGYHNVQDWFGRKFIELCAEYIINSASVAKAKGFTISREEALSSLYMNAEQSYRDAAKNPYLGVSSIGEYFHEQLRRLGMDQGRAVKVWEQILLFRKYFYSHADNVLIDGLGYSQFYEKINQYSDLEVYGLPKEYHFSNLTDVEKFEVYLNAVKATPITGQKGEKYLEMPTKFLTANEVKKVYPELVKRTFKLQYATLDKDTLQTKIGVRKTWEWQLEDKNWKKLQDKFPELAQSNATTSEQRMQALDKLNTQTRTLVDTYSRELIVEEHPEWITQSLEEIPLKEEAVELRERGGNYPFAGISNRYDLLQLLEEAPLGEMDQRLSSYSQDGRHYHKIQVMNRDEQEVIIPYAEASRDGTLDILFDKVLDCAYARVRAQQPTLYLKENGEWKSLADVKDAVAARTFSDLLESLDIVAEKEQKKLPQFCDWSKRDQAKIACRMLPFMKFVAEQIKEHPEMITEYVTKDLDIGVTSNVSKPLNTKLTVTKERIVVKDEHSPIPAVDAFTTPLEGWSPLRYYPQEGLVFFKVKEKGNLPIQALVRTKMLEAKQALGMEVFYFLGQKLLHEMQEKNAIVLEGRELVSTEGSS